MSATGGVLRRVELPSALAVAMGVATVASPLVAVLAPYLREEIPLPPTRVGLLVTTYASISALASWPAGILTDRLGSRRALTLVFGGSCIALVGVASAMSYSWLLLAMVVAGFANSLVNPATNLVIAEMVEPGRRGLIAGVKMGGVQVAVFAVGLTVPFAAENIGWRVPLALGALALCLLGLFVVLRRIESLTYCSTNQPSRLTWSTELLVLTVYSLLMSAGASASLTYLPLYSVDQLGSQPATGGVAVAVAGLLAIAGRLFWGRATERVRSMRPLTILGAMSLLSGLLLLLPSDTGAPVFWIGVAGIGFFALSFSAATTVALILAVRSPQMGRASGVMFVGFMIGFGAGPAGFGLVVESAGGYVLAWTAVASTFALAALVALRSAWFRATNAEFS